MLSPAAKTPLALTLGVLLSLAGIVLATRSSFFYADDYLNFAIAREKGLSLEYLRTAYFQHFAPGHRVLDYLIARPIGLEWGASLAILLSFWLGAVAAFAAALRVLLGQTWLWCVLSLAYASSPAWVRVVQWWASGAHVVPAFLGTSLVLLGALAWWRRRSRRSLATLTFGYVLALSFYSKPLLVSLTVALLLWFVLAPSLRPVAVVTAVRRDWPVLASLVACSVAYLVVVLVGGYNEGAPAATAGAWRSYLVLTWTRGIWPLLVGRWVEPSASELDDLAIVAAQVGLLVCVVASIARDRRAWRAWAFFAVLWLANVGLIGYARLALSGPDIGYDLRYNAEFAFLLPLTLALAFRPRSPSPSPSPSPRRPRLVTSALATAGVALFALSLASSYARLADRWPARAAGAWVREVEDSTRSLRASGVEPSVVDGPAPFSVVAGAAPPYNALSTVLPALDRPPEVASRRRARTVAVIEESGRVRPARLGPVGPRAGAPLRGLDGDGCARATGAPVQLERSFGSTGSPGAPGALLLTVPVRRVVRSGVLLVSVDAGGGYPPSANQSLAVSPGDEVLRIAVGGPGVQRVRLELQPGAAICLGSPGLLMIR